MEQYRQGSYEAFDRLYDLHADTLYGYLIGRLKDRALADDVFQGTWVKLHQKRSQYRFPLPFKPWLFVLCRNVMLDALRKNKREAIRVSRVQSEPVDAPSTEGLSSLSLVDALPALGELPPLQRQALELRFSEDLAFDEIARALGTSDVNVRQLVSRGIRQLRNSLKGRKGES